MHSAIWFGGEHARTHALARCRGESNAICMTMKSAHTNTALHTRAGGSFESPLQPQPRIYLMSAQGFITTEKQCEKKKNGRRRMDAQALSPCAIWFNSTAHPPSKSSPAHRCRCCVCVFAFLPPATSRMNIQMSEHIHIGRGCGMLARAAYLSDLSRGGGLSLCVAL